MSPFTIAVVLILSVLFIIMSIIPLLPGLTYSDATMRRSTQVKTKGAH
jgi:hypothetical protein